MTSQRLGLRKVVVLKQTKLDAFHNYLIIDKERNVTKIGLEVKCTIILDFEKNHNFDAKMFSRPFEVVSQL